MSVSAATLPPGAEVGVICLGEALIDQVVDVGGQQQNFPGGAPANVAVALARLGVPTEFIGSVGEDAQGQTLVELLQSLGVDCRSVQRSPRPTRIVEVRCSEQGDRVFGGFLGGTTTEFADAHLTAADLPESRLQTAQALVTGTLGLAYPHTRTAMARAADLVQSHQGQLVVDLNWRPTFWPQPPTALALIEPWLARADWLKFSTDEALFLFGTAQIADLVARFPAARGVLVTDGDRGCAYAIAGQTGTVPAFAVPVQETTGAGDAFLAGVLYQLYQRNWQVTDAAAIETLLTFASAYGALTTLKPGAIAAQPPPETLMAFLEERTGRPWTL